MNGLLLELADALDRTRSGTDRKSARLASEARSLARGALKICALGGPGRGKSTALHYIAKRATERGFEARVVDRERDCERVEFSDPINAVDAFLDDRRSANVEIPLPAMVRILDANGDHDLVQRLAETLADAEGVCGSDRSEGDYMDQCRANVLAILRELPSALIECG